MSRQEWGRLKDWTKEDKLRLYQAIRTHGSYNIDQIQQSIPNKTKEEIDEAIAFFKKKALKQETKTRVIRERSTASHLPYVPLNSWAKLLTETFPFNELHTDTATALRLIADFEDIPQPLCTEKIDFKKVYHTLANALEGKALCEDKLVIAVIDKCIVETALASKAFMKCGAYKNALKDIKIYDKDSRTIMKVTENNEMSLLHHLVMNRNYNPLNISEKHLKSTVLS